MHKLCEYIDDQLKELERKVSSGNKLSGSEIEYGDKLAHFKKSLLTNEAMEDAYGEGHSGRRDGRRYSRDEADEMMYGNSYARGRTGNVRRDSMGRYSRDNEHDEMIAELHELMREAPNEHIKQKFKHFIDEIETM